MIKVNVLCGGTSNEREVSLRSGKAVADALTQAGYSITMLDTTDDDGVVADCDVVFPVLHGGDGEDGRFQARLEALGVPFVGSGSAASKLCMDKSLYRQHMSAAGFLMPDGAVVDHAAYKASPLSAAPHVLKPVSGGSSIDTYIVRDASELDKDEAYVAGLFERNPTMLIEALINGTEITVGMLGDTALPVIEIIPPADHEFDYENKYNGKTQELCPPQHVEAAVQAAAQRLTERVHAAAGCRDLSRTDYIISADGSLYLLETNTLPGMTNQSLYPKMAAQSGLAFSALADRLVQLALNR